MKCQKPDERMVMILKEGQSLDSTQTGRGQQPDRNKLKKKKNHPITTTTTSTQTKKKGGKGRVGLDRMTDGVL